MAGIRKRSDIDALYAKYQMLGNPYTPYSTGVSLRSRGRGVRSGYINRLNRLSRKAVNQLRGLPGSGPRIKDWLRREEK